eukprot:GILJ01015278.1.p1 GENE.GILJ01015278.1~~GILJ01015278.1.p1  ORF type:complete len:892 (+),score=73.68 GILJ01015278.1:344-3019(+)
MSEKEKKRKREVTKNQNQGHEAVEQQPKENAKVNMNVTRAARNEKNKQDQHTAIKIKLNTLWGVPMLSDDNKQENNGGEKERASMDSHSTIAAKNTTTTKVRWDRRKRRKEQRETKKTGKRKRKRKRTKKKRHGEKRRWKRGQKTLKRYGDQDNLWKSLLDPEQQEKCNKWIDEHVGNASRLAHELSHLITIHVRKLLQSEVKDPSSWLNLSDMQTYYRAFILMGEPDYVFKDKKKNIVIIPALEYLRQTVKEYIQACSPYNVVFKRVDGDTQILKHIAIEMAQNVGVHLDYDKQVQRIRQTMAVQLGKAEWADRALRQLQRLCKNQRIGFLDGVEGVDPSESGVLQEVSERAEGQQRIHQSIDRVVALHAEWLFDVGGETKTDENDETVVAHSETAKKVTSTTDSTNPLSLAEERPAKAPRVQNLKFLTWKTGGKENPARLMQYLHQMQQWRKDVERYSFPLLPLRTIKRMSIKLDPGILRSMLLACSVVKKGQWSDPQLPELWEIYIGRPGQWRRGWSCNHTIHTDGITASIVLCRPSQSPSPLPQQSSTAPKKKLKLYKLRRGRTSVTLSDLEQTDNVLKQCNLVSVDPGRTDLMTMYHWKPDGTGYSTRFSRAQYYHEMGSLENSILRQEWRRPLIPIDNALSAHSCRSSVLSEHLEYLKMKWKHDDELWEEVLKPRYSNLNFRQHCAKKRSVDRFLRREFSAPNTVVAMGDAKFSVSASGNLTGKLKSLIDRVRDYVPVIMINEFRTSMMCSSCCTSTAMMQPVFFPSRHEHNEVMKINREYTVLLGAFSVKEARRRFPLRPVAPWSLRRCSSTSCRSGRGFVNRDMNASVNIGHVFVSMVESGARPAYLQRPPAVRKPRSSASASSRRVPQRVKPSPSIKSQPSI